MTHVWYSLLFGSFWTASVTLRSVSDFDARFLLEFVMDGLGVVTNVAAIIAIALQLV